MGIPIIIPTSRASFKPWIKIVGVILIAVGIWVTVSNVDFKEVELVPECTVAFSDMNKTDVYETTDMIVFDSFATTTKDNNAELGNCVVSVGATVNSMDILYDSTIAVYENAVEGLKESGLNVMSTELSLEFVCLPDESDFEEYCRSEKSFNHVMTIVVFVLLILGIFAVVFSYRERKGQDGTAVYYNPDFKPQY